ncbi:MAG: bifunctional pyr operon transcriptional regulator/uracil phosphoribosyltransferase PyrR [bacterium]
MKVLLDNLLLEKTLKRMSHEIIEKNENLNDLVFVGIKRKGVPIAQKVANNILLIENIKIDIEEIDITGYRDDEKTSDIDNKFNIDINNKIVVLFDDVLQTGRTVRSAMDALVHIGRPKKIQLAILVDRGHRELPIRADYVGKNIPTSISESVVYDKDENIVYIK